MAKRFYLSFVYDVNGYDRYDMVSSDSLEKLDEVVSDFNNRNEVLDAYMNEFNIDRKKGKVCIIFEDLDIKKKEIKEYGEPSTHTKEEINKLYSYAHLIPIMYKNERLMNIDACLINIKHKLFNPKVIEAITEDLITKDKKRISINKKYIFETEEEKHLVDIDSDYKEALDIFYRRLKKSSPEEQYFYCRCLMDLCGLRVKEKKKVTNLRINKKKLEKIIKDSELTPSEMLERETEDMDEFYLHHDLDEVILLSPNSNRPIGSEGKKRK